MCIFMHNTKLHFIGITAEGKNGQTYVKNAMYGYISTFCYLLTSEYSNHIYFLQLSSSSHPLAPPLCNREHPSANFCLFDASLLTLTPPRLGSTKGPSCRTAVSIVNFKCK